MNDDLIENPSPRCPLALVLDTSGSMSGEPIDELNAGVGLLLEELKRDDLARWSVELAAYAAGGSAQRIFDFTVVEKSPAPFRSMPRGHAFGRGGRYGARRPRTAQGTLPGGRHTLLSTVAGDHQRWRTDGFVADGCAARARLVAVEKTREPADWGCWCRHGHAWRLFG